MRWEFRTDDGAAHGRSTFSFVSEKDYRLKIDIHWRQSPQNPNPTMVVLRSPNEERWASEGFISGLDGLWNIAYLETRGVGETGWSPDMQWHVRRASAWTGRTVASMRVYDVLRCLQALRTLKAVRSDTIAIAARDEMCAVALYAALLDGKTVAVLVQNPPATQNAPSSPDGRGEAIEMLNCLRVTDIPQVAGLLFPTNIVVVGSMPDSYVWAKDLYQILGMPKAFQNITKFSQWKPGSL
jgi:hypothetical protein